MIYKIMSIVIVLNAFSGFSQEDELLINQDTLNRNIVGYKSENYKAYFNLVRLKSNLVLIQKMESRTGSDYTVFEFPTILKYSISEKLHILLGPKIDFIKNNSQNSTNTTVYSTFVIQYDVSNSLMLDAKFNYRLTNDVSLPTDYTFGSKSSFVLGSKLKF